MDAMLAESTDEQGSCANAVPNHKAQLGADPGGERLTNRLFAAPSPFYYCSHVQSVGICSNNTLIT